MKVTGFKKTLRAAFALLAGVLCFGAFGGLSAAKPTEQPTAAKAETETIFRFEMEVPEQFLGEVGGTREFKFAFSLNQVWHEVNNVTSSSYLTYDVYSPNAIPGIGFFSAQEQKNWSFLHNSFGSANAMVDANGVSVKPEADLSDYITDGWYQRTITMTGLGDGEYKLAHAVIGAFKPVGTVWNAEDLVDGNKIVVYYKNINYHVNGNIVGAVHPSINPANGLNADNFTGQQKGSEPLNGYLGWQWQGCEPFVEGTTTVKDTIKLSGEAPVFPEVEETNPLLSTKAQTNVAGTALRFVAAVDSLNYQSVGFEIKVGDKVKTVSSKTVYTSIFAGGTEVFPTVFGENAQYMFTYTIWDIPAEQAATTIQVRAFWTTMDGAVEYGAARTFSVSAVQAAQ